MGTAITVEGHVIDIGAQDYFSASSLRVNFIMQAYGYTNPNPLQLCWRSVYDELNENVVGVIAIVVALENFKK